MKLFVARFTRSTIPATTIEGSEFELALRGIRGAATVDANSKEKIWRTAQELVTKILSSNEFGADNIGAIIFSVTSDLTAAFPSAGVRQLNGFKLVPLFDALEPNIENSMPMCIRVLILADLEKTAREVHHVYLGEARKLRPDLSGND